MRSRSADSPLLRKGAGADQSRNVVYTLAEGNVPMPVQRDSSGLLLMALATLWLGASCSNSESSPAVVGGGAPASGTAGAASGTETAPTGDGRSTGAAMGTSNAMGASVVEGIGNVTRADGTSGPPDPGATGDGATMDPAPSAGCGSPAGLTSGRTSIDVAGKAREYILLVPENYDQNRPYRLIFGWHPWGGSAQQTESRGYFGLESVADGQAILVAPEGQDFRGNGLGWGNEGGEDIDFLHAMLDRFSAQLCIDENRIFSTGFSFGAMFSFTVACSQDGRMRAIAPQAGNATTSGPCEDGTRSVATMAFIGTDDSLLTGHRRAVDILVERNGCSTQPTTMQASWCDGLGANNQPCTCVEYPGCKQGYPVISCEYKAGHQFAPNAGATLWNFFSQF
jgi:polyhydroxybutyrate depolymerase